MTIGGSYTRPEVAPPGPRTEGNGGGSGGSGYTGGGVGDPVEPRQPQRVCPTIGEQRPNCRINEPAPAEADDTEPATPVRPAVTIADLAAFTPAGPVIGNEPAGFGVVGMPTNVTASSAPQTVAARLFGAWDVTVRFTPAGFRFAYGDGTTVTTATGGASWAALGQAEFTPTATSHVYRDRGEYTVAVTALYTATVTFADGFVQDVPGTVAADAGGYVIRVVEVHTALVDNTCIEDPDGPGC